MLSESEKLISQLISGISRVLEKLPKYFNGGAISKLAVTILLVLFASIDLYLTVCV